MLNIFKSEKHTNMCGCEGLGTLLLKSHQPEHGEQGREGNASNKETVVSAATCSMYTQNTHTHCRETNLFLDLAWFRRMENVNWFTGMANNFLFYWQQQEMYLSEQLTENVEGLSGISHWRPGQGKARKVFTTNTE